MRIACWSGGSCRDLPPHVAVSLLCQGRIRRTLYHTGCVLSVGDALVLMEGRGIVWPDGTHLYSLTHGLSHDPELDQYPEHPRDFTPQVFVTYLADPATLAKENIIREPQKAP